MKYRIQYTSRARKDLHRLDKKTAQRVIQAIHTLSDDPYHYIKKLEGAAPEHPVYTFRIGLFYRAILTVHDSVLVVHVLEIEDRKRAFKDF